MDALTVIARGNRESIDRLERIVVQHGAAIAQLRRELEELRGEVAELRGEVAELRGPVGEILAWVRTQRDGGEPPDD